MKNNEQSNPYDDIINLPHYVSKYYPQMPMAKRAAQFSPFAALSGYKEAIQEASRFTEEKRTLGEDARNLLDQKLNFLRERIKEQHEITVTHFVPDTKKEGGAYIKTMGYINKDRLL